MTDAVLDQDSRGWIERKFSLSLSRLFSLGKEKETGMKNGVSSFFFYLGGARGINVTLASH